MERGIEQRGFQFGLLRFIDEVEAFLKADVL